MRKFNEVMNDCPFSILVFRKFERILALRVILKVMYLKKYIYKMSNMLFTWLNVHKVCVLFLLCLNAMFWRFFPVNLIGNSYPSTQKYITLGLNNCLTFILIGEIFFDWQLKPISNSELMGYFSLDIYGQPICHMHIE